MVVGGPGGGELDQGTAALRQLMSRAADDEAARAEALQLILLRRVLVGTWPHSPESVRTLTNSNGEQAMPLFTGFDVLLEAAHRFGWTSPDGAVSHREMAAADALRGAVANGVHFVVLDISTDCAVEFGREEIDEALRARPKGESAATPPQKRSSHRPADGHAPAVKMPANLSAVIIEETVAPRSRAGRPDPRAEPQQAKQQLAVVNVTRVPQSVLQARQAAAQAQEALAAAAAAAAATAEPQTSERLTERGDPTIEDRLPPAFGDDAAPAFAHDDTLPPVAAAAPPPALPPAPPPAAAPAFDRDLASLPSLDSAPAPAMAAAPFAPGNAPSFDLPLLQSVPPLPSADAVPALPESLDPLSAAFAAPTDQPQARPGALQAAAMVTQVGKMAKDGATQQAAREVATMLKGMAAQGSVEGEAEGDGEGTGAAGVTSAAKNAIVAMLGASAAEASNKKKKRRGQKPSSSGTIAAQQAPAEKEAKSDRESGIEPRGLCPPENPLADALLSQIADVLRKYPEVEWACEVSDGTADAGDRDAGLADVPDARTGDQSRGGQDRAARTARRCRCCCSTIRSRCARRGRRACCSSRGARRPQPSASGTCRGPRGNARA